MKFGLILPSFGAHSDPRTLAGLARLAETAGWDGVFLPDTMQMVGTADLDTSNPWIDLAAIALQTHQTRIDPVVSTPDATDSPSRHPNRLALFHHPERSQGIHDPATERGVAKPLQQLLVLEYERSIEVIQRYPCLSLTWR